VPRLPKVVYRVAHEADARLSKLRRSFKREVGLARPHRIVPYRGYGTAERAWIKARVIEDRGEVERNLSRGIVGGAFASFVRFYTAEVPDALVEVSWAGERLVGASDAEGFVEIEMKPPPGLGAGWHDVRLSIRGEGKGGGSVTAPVLVVGDEAEYGVISDVDDTVIVTDVRNLAKRAWALFMAEAFQRLPFPGVAELYDAFARGTARTLRHNPLFYVSSSPWNLYEHLDHFLEEHHIPPGPILLRDWGLTRDGIAPGGGHGHKRKKMKGVIEAYVDLPFVLIGDSGQEDAEHYLSLVEEYGARIRVVYIRQVPSKPGREGVLAEIGRRMRAAGSELVVVSSSEEIRADAEWRGLI
jgi:phosphatidate phosphatase APP1